MDKPCVVITGPYNKIMRTPPASLLISSCGVSPFLPALSLSLKNSIKAAASFGHAYGTTISTYPKLKAKQLREGDPICDSYRVHCHPNGTILCVADGSSFLHTPLPHYSLHPSSPLSSTSFSSSFLLILLRLWMGRKTKRSRESNQR